MVNKKDLSFAIVLFELLKFCLNDINPNVDPNSYCYATPACSQPNWGGFCNTGSNQSPIDIKLIPFIPQYAPLTVFELNQNYATEVRHKFFGQNNGHTGSCYITNASGYTLAQFDVNPNTAALTSHLEISGGKLEATYKFAQLHFHWSQSNTAGSEHRINGFSYPLELHIVHYKSTYATFAAATAATVVDREAVAVMAILCQISSTQNDAFVPIIDALNSLDAPGVVKEFDIPIRISALYPQKMEFARYQGSLTTPNCNEIVIWTVFLRPVEVSIDQMDAFRRLTNKQMLSAFNYRNAQPLNGRKVLFYKGTFGLEPLLTLSSLFSYFMSFFTNLFRNGLIFPTPIFISPTINSSGTKQ